MDSPIVKCGRVWDLHIHSNQCSSALPEMKKLGVDDYIDGLFDVFKKASGFGYGLHHRS